MYYARRRSWYAMCYEFRHYCCEDNAQLTTGTTPWQFCFGSDVATALVLPNRVMANQNVFMPFFFVQRNRPRANVYALRETKMYIVKLYGIMINNIRKCLLVHALLYIILIRAGSTYSNQIQMRNRAKSHSQLSGRGP